jgi:hypothetical protein
MNTNNTNNTNNTPRYEIDDGPLTAEQIALIRKLNPENPKAKWSKSLFEMTVEEYIEMQRKRGVKVD